MTSNLKTAIAFYKLIKTRRLIFIFVGGILVSLPIILNVIYPILIREIIEKLELEKVIDYMNIILLAILYTFTILISYFGDILYNKHKYTAAQELRDKIFEYAFYFPVKKFKEYGSAYFTKLMNDQVNNAFVVLDYTFIQNIFLIIRTLVVLGIIFFWDKILFIIFMLNTFTVFMFSKLLSHFTQPLFGQWQELSRNITAFIVETFTNLQEILSGKAVKIRNKKYLKTSKEMTNLAVKAEVRRISLDKMLTEIPNYISKIVILLYCFRLILSGKMSVGSLWAIWTYFSFVIEPMSVFKTFSRVILESSTIINSVLEFFGEAKSIKESYRNIQLDFEQAQDIIKLEELSFSHNDSKVIDNITFSIPKDKIVGIMGISGEGKSTLLNILLGFERDYKGSVKFLDTEVKDISPLTIFENIAYYSQSIGIFNETLEENIIMGRDYDEKKLKNLILELNIDHLRNRKLGQDGSFISGGERQKIQLARFLYAEKPIFILDEPFTNLDAINEKRMIEIISKYLKGRTGIIISHKLNILALAETCIVLNKGRIIDQGNLKYLLRSNELSRDIINSYIETTQNTVNQLD